MYRLAYNDYVAAFKMGLRPAHLAAGDPTNTEWQRDLSVSHEKIGDVRSAQGDLKAALSSYQNGLEMHDDGVNAFGFKVIRTYYWNA